MAQAESADLPYNPVSWHSYENCIICLISSDTVSTLCRECLPVVESQ